MNNVTLNTEKINEIGNYISTFLQNCGIDNFNLSMNVNPLNFKKIDEDLFYKFNKNTNNEFIPSDDNIYIAFGNGFINIKKTDKS